ncbi:hypothetical protein P692DRAFT_20920594 [Suillus brevipes Sb2]|nr:hypothetical protein P692DRAFT_20920594 [Suillus brevipes Sb2]
MPPVKPINGIGTGPPKAHSPPPTQAPNTRRTTRTPNSIEDIIAAPHDVMDTDSTEKFLTSKLLCLEDQSFTLAHLSSILFHITQMSAATPVPVISAIRAVAFILKKHTACEIADAAAKTLATSLSTALTESISTRLVDHTIAALAPQVASIHAASEALAKTAQQAEDTLTTTLDKAERNISIAAERIEESADALFATVTDCQNAIKLLTPSLDTTQERLNHLSTQFAASPPIPTLTQPSYSSIAAANLPPTVDKAIG